MDTDVAQLKRMAAAAAVEHVEPGMIIGLGSGSTAIWVTRLLGERLQSGQLKGIRGVPCSLSIEQEARRCNVPLTSLNDHPVVDLTIDGADEVAPNLDLIKGGGGALLREKIVAQASQREIIVVDESKLSPGLGVRWPVPVEVVPFGWRVQAAYLESLGARVALRQTREGVPFETNQGNLILDCHFGPIADPPALAALIRARAGIVEHGLFLGLASEVIVASPAGIRRLERQ